MLGASLGAGRIKVSQIDGYPVEVDGSHHAIVMVAEDVKGSVARIAGLLSESGVNIATLRLSRKHRGGDAFMVIELDEAPSSDVGEALKLLSWVRWAHRIDKVGG
jgi:L-serine dehydratase